MGNFGSFIWVAIMVLALIMEVNTAALVAIWFVPAALVSMILAFFEVPFDVQVVLFLVLSILFILVFWKVFKKKGFIKPIATNADSVIGENAVVVEAIDNLSYKGQVIVKGRCWSARSAKENEKYDEMEVLKVVAIEGVTLIVQKENQKEKEN